MTRGDEHITRAAEDALVAFAQEKVAEGAKYRWWLEFAQSYGGSLLPTQQTKAIVKCVLDAAAGVVGDDTRGDECVIPCDEDCETRCHASHMPEWKRSPVGDDTPPRDALVQVGFYGEDGEMVGMSHLTVQDMRAGVLRTASTYWRPLFTERARGDVVLPEPPEGEKLNLLTTPVEVVDVEPLPAVRYEVAGYLWEARPGGTWGFTKERAGYVGEEPLYRRVKPAPVSPEET